MCPVPSGDEWLQRYADNHSARGQPRRGLVTAIWAWLTTAWRARVAASHNTGARGQHSAQPPPTDSRGIGRACMHHASAPLLGLTHPCVHHDCAVVFCCCNHAEMMPDVVPRQRLSPLLSCRQSDAAAGTDGWYTRCCACNTNATAAASLPGSPPAQTQRVQYRKLAPQHASMQLPAASAAAAGCSNFHRAAGCHSLSPRVPINFCPTPSTAEGAAL